MNKNISEIEKYCERLTLCNSDFQKAFEIIKDGRHKEGYEKIIKTMKCCDYAHPMGWTYTGVIAARQGAANSDIYSFAPAEKGFKKAVSFHSHFFQADDNFFELCKIIVNSIGRYTHIYELKAENDTSDLVMQLLDKATSIPENGYNSTRQKEQINVLQAKIDKAKEQCRNDVSKAALHELAVYEYILNTVNQLDGYSQKSIELSEAIIEQLKKIDNLDKDYIIDTVLTASKNIRDSAIENITESKKAVDLKKKKEKKEAIERYWEEHSEERAELERQIEEADTGLKEITSQLGDCDKEYSKVSKKRDKFSSSFNSEKKELELDLDELNDKMDNLGMFKTKEKKNLVSRIEKINTKIDEINNKIFDEKNQFNESIDKELLQITEKKKALETRNIKLKKEIERIREELAKDRL